MASPIPESGPLAAFLRYGCPGLGAGIAFILFMSPLPTALAVAKRGYLGEVNALPFAMMVANCAAWMFYGAVIVDYFVYVANIPGLVGGLFYTLVCFRFSKAAAQNALTAIALASAVLFSCVGVASMAVNSPAVSKTLWGATSVGVLGLYYSAPLATLAKVIRERSSASLHWPLCLMNAINGSLWFAYGLALKDMFICAPNGVGAFFNLMCLGFCVAFPRREAAAAEGGADASAAVVAAKQKAAVPVPDLVGGNWGGLRIQSVRFPAPPSLGSGLNGSAAGTTTTGGDASGSSPGGSASPSPSQPQPMLPPAAAERGGGSFLDLAAMRWRTGRSFMSLPRAGSSRGARNGNGGGGGGGAPLPPAAAAAAGGANGSRVALFSAAAADDEEAPRSSVIDRPIRESGEQ